MAITQKIERRGCIRLALAINAEIVYSRPRMTGSAYDLIEAHAGITLQPARLRILADRDRSRSIPDRLHLRIGELERAAERRLEGSRKRPGPLGRSRPLIEVIERAKPRLSLP